MGVLTACLFSICVFPLTVRAEAVPQAPRDTIEVTGQNDPAQDIPAIQDALDQADTGDTLLLRGVFDLSGCENGFTLNKNITVQGPVNPTRNPAAATQIRNCGPAFVIATSEAEAGTLTIQNLWFREQTALSVLINNSQGPINILSNLFTENTPATAPSDWGIRFAVGSANLISATVEGLVTIEENVVDWSDSAGNDTFEGDDNGFAFAATNLSLTIRNNVINTLGEGIEIEGAFGADTHYLVEGNSLQTLVPPSPLGQVDSPPGSAGEGALGGHPAVIKLHANEGTFSILDNTVDLSGLSTGVCIMATSRNPDALTGKSVNRVDGNNCQMDNQLTGILGGWGSQPPFFNAASMNGTVVTNNLFSGTAQFGIALIDRSLTSVSGPVINSGRSNHFRNNDFSALTAARADIAFDQETYDNFFQSSAADTVINRGSNHILTEYMYMPIAQKN